ncbi:hypothetical protein HHK36_013007 [Tetracentron sinense]|uniref:Uncharacterized protein n=1 Tax=Tetracentron sinense TaxID=13715 RepID=A0A834ZAD1_TETSI|nr:hypothetical protein HHK36_013007 [Tetracentron sinense]
MVLESTDGAMVSKDNNGLDDYLLRTYACGRGVKSTDSHIFYNAMDVSVFLPTSEFPHPLSRVKQQAGYRVSLFSLLPH